MVKDKTKVKQKINIYKLKIYSNIGMLPSDPTGSLDDFFSVNNLIFGGKK